MNTLKCGIGDCPSVFETEDALSPKARYICQLHTGTEQDVFFQNMQFDPDIREGTDPIAYWRGKAFNYAGKKGRGFKSGPGPANTASNRRMKKAKEALVGHEHAKEILAVLGRKLA